MPGTSETYAPRERSQTERTDANEQSRRWSRHTRNSRGELYSQIWALAPVTLAGGGIIGALIDQGPVGPIICGFMIGMKIIDFSNVGQFPMTEDRAQTTGPVRIIASSLIPGLQTATRFFDRKNYQRGSWPT